MRVRVRVRVKVRVRPPPPPPPSPPLPTHPRSQVSLIGQAASDLNEMVAGFGRSSARGRGDGEPRLSAF